MNLISHFPFVLCVVTGVSLPLCRPPLAVLIFNPSFRRILCLKYGVLSTTTAGPSHSDTDVLWARVTMPDLSFSAPRLWQGLVYGNVGNGNK